MIALVIVGAGGFGREVLDVVYAINADAARYEILGVVDDRLSELGRVQLEAAGVAHLGSLDAWLQESPTHVEHVVAIGSPFTREQIVARIEGIGGRFATLVHPTAVVGSAGTLAAGTVLCAGVQVSTNVHVGAHCHLNPGAIIGHDTRLEDFVSVNPGAIVSGDVRVGARSLIGAGATILQGLTIGRGVVVGAAACVTSHVDDGLVVVGVPARPVRPIQIETPTETEPTS